MLSGGPKLIKCTEDEDFMSAFDTMLSETIQQRHQEAAKIPQADIAIPMHLKGQKGAKCKLAANVIATRTILLSTFTAFCFFCVLTTSAELFQLWT